MPVTLSPTAPSTDDYTPLHAHQASTPTSFFTGPPVLHAHLTDCRILASQVDLDASGDLWAWWGIGVDGLDEDGNFIGSRLVKEGVEVRVSTDSLVLCHSSTSSSSTATSTAPTRQRPTQALKITYPAISLHATQRLYHDSSATNPNEAYSTDPPPASDTDSGSHPPAQKAIQLSAIYLQLDPHHETRADSNPNGDDADDGSSLALLIVVPPFTLAAEGAGANGTNGDKAARLTPTPNQAATGSLFDALSACADLWPDEDVDGEDGETDGAIMGGFGGGGGGGMPGEGGWITAENAHEFEGMFADVEEGGEDGGNGVTVLGPGAGTRRARDGVGDGDSGVEAVPGAEEETKWQRTA